jgi:hypothetical protein
MINSRAQIKLARPVHDDQVGKPFVVVDKNSPKCLVCEQLFTPQEASHHAQGICYPRWRSP